MFKQYKTLIDKAINDEDISNKEYINKKNNLSLNIKQTLQNEIENLNNKQLLKDYSPIKHTNTMTEFNIKFNNLLTDEINNLGKIKNKLHKNLLTIMEVETIPKNYPTELYKIITSCSSKTNYICRVYFTLIPLPQWNCIAGDPIRVEWVDTTGARNNDKTDKIHLISERTGQGWTGLKIPQFNNAGQSISPNELYDFNHWGINSSQQQWWKEWIKNNRPM